MQTYGEKTIEVFILWLLCTAPSVIRLRSAYMQAICWRFHRHSHELIATNSVVAADDEGMLHYFFKEIIY
jgi:hypothetical protein